MDHCSDGARESISMGVALWGAKTSKLFKKALHCLAQVIEQTDSLSLLTDGERRYGNLLFEICYEVIRNGKPGRPLKRLPKGVRVRLKKQRV